MSRNSDGLLGSVSTKSVRWSLEAGGRERADAGGRPMWGWFVTDPWEPLLEAPERDVVIPTDDESITRRRRALAPIQVLTEIERTKGSLDGAYWERYDLFTIALAVIDQVALAMGISAGRTWEEALDY